MVDKALFIDTSSAKNVMQQLEMITNNLANSNTIGFRADYEVQKQAAVSSNKNEARVFSQLDRSYSNFDAGPMIQTGRDLDNAISGKGFFAVQSKSGDEGYTRAGNFQIKNGLLTTNTGEMVLGKSGVINIPKETQRVIFSPDGTVSIKIADQKDVAIIDRLKLVNPRTSDLSKGKDGLFRLGNGQSAQRDPNVQLIVGSLEGSNVNPVEALTSLIEISRQFEMHAHLISDFKDNATKANQILQLPK